MKNNLPKKLTTLTSIFCGIAFNASLLFAETTPSSQDLVSENQPTEVKSGDRFVSQGKAVHLTAVDYTVSTIKDWKVAVGNNSLMMTEVLAQDLDQSKTVYDKPVYRKNVQFLVYNKSLSFDQKRFDEISSYLTKRIGENPNFSGFQIDEQKLIDLHGKQDAYLIYTSMQYKDMKMRQMHILMAGENQQVLSSYTDLADTFEKDQLSMELAWNAMTAYPLEGTPVYRYQTLANYTPIAATLLMALIVLVVIKRIREKNVLTNASKEMHSTFADDSNIEDLERNWELAKTKVSNSVQKPISTTSPVFTTNF